MSLHDSVVCFEPLVSILTNPTPRNNDNVINWWDYVPTAALTDVMDHPPQVKVLFGGHAVTL